jgi:hypothetical protein
MLTGYLRDSTEYLSASTVRRVVQVASMSVVGSAIAISRLDREVRRVTTTPCIQAGTQILILRGV